MGCECVCVVTRDIVLGLLASRKSFVSGKKVKSGVEKEISEADVLLDEMLCLIDGAAAKANDTDEKETALEMRQSASLTEGATTSSTTTNPSLTTAAAKTATATTATSSTDLQT
eukprot:c11633_g1_i1.p2 GENE.c11633_g1_i1~~c11633_g1_i1.p2  ORF type:complete len:114 (-),score=26.67 c11633_g1_i1:243-584(-)